MLKYYFQAFNLLNQNKKIFLFYLLVILGSNLYDLTSSFGLRHWTFLVATIFFWFLLMAYLFVPLVAFYDKSNGTEITYGYLLTSARKMFIKSLLLLFILFVLIIVFGFMLGGLLGLFAVSLKIPRNILYPFSSLLLGSLLVPIFNSVGIFYFIEKTSLFTSLSNSIMFTFKHPRFTLLPIFPAIVLSLSARFFGSYKNILWYLLIAVMNYILLVISAAFVIYYKTTRTPNEDSMSLMKK